MQCNLIDSRSRNKNLYNTFWKQLGKVRIEAGYGLYYRTVHFIRYYNGIVDIKGDVSILRRCRLKYLVGKHYGACNLFSSGSAKKLHI